MSPRSRVSIEQDTIILPHVVADTVSREVIAGGDLQNQAAAWLAARADEVYLANEDFAKKVRASGNKGRDYLYMFMRHWLASWLKKNAPAVSRSLPSEYANGLPPPPGFRPVGVSGPVSPSKKRKSRATRG